MNSTFVLKVILLDDTSQRLTLPNGLPPAVDDLIEEVQRQCDLSSNIKLQFMDPLFGNEFMNLTSLNELQNRGTIKVVPLNAVSLPSASLPISEDSYSLSSISCVDTDILTSSSSPEPEPTCSRSCWPSTFIVPQFSYDSELKLEQANAEYRDKGKTLIPDLQLRSNILNVLNQEIIRYGVYITDRQFDRVGEALITKHPCLSEKGSLTGYAGWKQRLKNKLAHYRYQLRKIGCPEVAVNSATNRPKGKSPAYAIKKPKRSEVNYCPRLPAGETEETLEKLRVELLDDVKQRNNREVVRTKMDKTFAYRRLEVVRDAPMVEDFKLRWPALFDVLEINLEFKKLTTLPLQCRFFSQLDIHSAKLLKLYKKRGGQIGNKLKKLLEVMNENDDIDIGRECIMKGLCVYLNEDPDNLIKEHVGNEQALFDAYVEDTTVGVFTVKRHDIQLTPDDIGIVLEGQIVLQEIDNVPLAIALLFGLIYALNMDYPAALRYFFEVLQKVVMELDGTTISKKAQVLKNRLLE